MNQRQPMVRNVPVIFFVTLLTLCCGSALAEWAVPDSAQEKLAELDEQQQAFITSGAVTDRSMRPAGEI